ncbi:MAG TPA: hypothetical protein DCS35_07110 [Vibrio sp.]|nr:hypothetical protein [Vibrio sp.]
MNDKVQKRATSSSDLFIGEIDTSIGMLSVFSYRVKHMMALEKLINGGKAHASFPESYIRSLIRVTCNPSEDVIENQEPEAILSQDDVDALTEDDLDAFSSLFLQDAEYLVKETVINKHKDGETEVISLECGEPIAVQDSSERPYEYLYRLFVIDEKKTEKQRQKMTDRLGLSGSLMKQFEHTSQLGAIMDKQLKAIQPITASAAVLNWPINDTHADLLRHAGAVKKITDPLASVTIVDSPKIAPINKMKLSDDIWPPKDKLEPTENILNKINSKHEEERIRDEKALELSEQAVEHSNAQLQVMNIMAEQMINLNQNQLQAAAESKETNEKSGKIARQGLHINWAVLAATLVGLIVGSIPLYVTYSTAQMETELQKENTQLKAELGDKDYQLKQMEQQNKKIAELEERLSKLQSEPAIKTTQAP